jgi:hypothetical protein
VSAIDSSDTTMVAEVAATSAIAEFALAHGEAAALVAAAPALLSFDPVPVACPHCSTHLGTRGLRLAQPYRYDSVTSDHMSVVYASELAYPEFLLTYTSK